MNLAVKPASGAAEIAFAYHRRSKHSLERYAAGPETLDWDMQPNPFREFAGSARTPLSLTADRIETRFADIYAPGSIDPAPLTLAAVSILMQLSMGLSAWKECGPDRWALRRNPSSGNLHPTEAYVIARDVSGLDNGVHHAGLRGTGIGCFFDDTLHEMLGLRTTQFPSLYHFAVGRPLVEDRIRTLPAYSSQERKPREQPS
jgi:hypothetical protein